MSEWLKSIFIPVGFSKRREKFVQWPENLESAEGWCFAKPRVLQKKNGGFPEEPAQAEGHCHERGGQEGGGNRIRTGTPPDGNRRDLSKQPNQNNAVHSTIPQDQGVHCTGKVSRVFSSSCMLTEINTSLKLLFSGQGPFKKLCMICSRRLGITSPSVGWPQKQLAFLSP